jgi:hypothetical protein
LTQQQPVFVCPGHRRLEALRANFGGQIATQILPGLRIWGTPRFPAGVV